MKKISQLTKILTLTLLIVGCSQSEPEPEPEITIGSPASKVFRIEENNQAGHIIIDDVKQFYQRTPELPDDITLTVEISDNQFLDVDGNTNVMVKNSI